MALRCAPPAGNRALRQADVRWRRRLGTARHLHRESGLRAVAFVALQRLEPVLHLHPEWFFVFTYPVGDAQPPPGGGPAGTEIGPSEDGELLTGLGHERATVRRRLGLGDLCVAAVDGEGLAGFVWYRRGLYDEEGILFPIAPDEAWGYDLLVAERRRGEGLSSAIARAARPALRERGVARIVTAIDAVNLLSLRAARRRGAHEAGRVTMLRAGRVSVRRERWAGRRARWRVYAVPTPAERPLPGTVRLSPPR